MPRKTNDLDLHHSGSQSSGPLCPVNHIWIYGEATRQSCAGTEVFVDVNITLHDGIDYGFMDATGIHIQEGNLEESLGALELLIANNDVAVRPFIALL